MTQGPARAAPRPQQHLVVGELPALPGPCLGSPVRETPTQAPWAPDASPWALHLSFPCRPQQEVFLPAPPRQQTQGCRSPDLIPLCTVGGFSLVSAVWLSSPGALPHPAQAGLSGHCLLPGPTDIPGLRPRPPLSDSNPFLDYRNSYHIFESSCFSSLCICLSLSCRLCLSPPGVQKYSSGGRILDQLPGD